MDSTYNTDNASKNYRNDSKTKDSVMDAAKDAGGKVTDFIKSARENVSHTTETVTSEIRNKPVQSSLIALGVGFLLSTLFRR